MPAPALISVLARSLLSGDASAGEAQARVARTLGRSWRWLPALALRYAEQFGGRARPRHREVLRFLLSDPGFSRARARYGSEISIAEWIAEPQRMQPVAAAQHWNLPAIESTGNLASWLSLTASELDWFADLKELGNKLNNPKFQHYHYRVLPKRWGGVRLLEAPKPWLKLLQRRILTGILDRIPAHPASHGFVKGRSIRTFVAPHAGKRVLLRLDCQDFFPLFPGVRVQAAFRSFGYPEEVADRLGGICANAAPLIAWGSRPAEIDGSRWYDARALYARPHLPQGAPTSPSLANLMAYRLDCRLTSRGPSCSYSTLDNCAANTIPRGR